MRRKCKNKQNRKLLIILTIFVFAFFIFKVGKIFASTEKFSLTKVVISQKSDSVNVNSISFENNVISNDITFHKVGDCVTYELTIKNNNLRII